ncbi:hypothetical protein D3C72_1680130 [compost metagenome]
MFSITKITGRFHTAARFRLSRKVPWLEAPSPQKVMPTSPLPRNLAASAAPQISGAPAPRMPLAPIMPLDRSAICIEPPLPLHEPPFLP